MAKDWMTFYYADPQPERFVEEVRSLAVQGLLADPERAFPAVVFLSCVIAANLSSSRTWFDALSDLSPSNWRSLERAAWFSRTSELRSYFSARDTEQNFAVEPPDVLEMTMQHPVLLDGLWAFYFATGDHRAVRRIISALDYMSDFGAAKSYAQTKKTEADKARALRDGIFQAASWSLESLMTRHEPLKAFCGDLVRTGDLTPNERCSLAIILAKLDPTTWRVQIDGATGKASISWVNVA